MKRKLVGAFTAVFAALIAFSLVADTPAFSERLKVRKDRKPRPKSNTFSISGTYTGTIGGKISIRGKNVWITKNTAVYVVGDGLEKNPFVTNGSVYVSGVTKRGNLVAKMVVVRPAKSRSSIGLRPPADAMYRIPSKSNKNVGVLTEDAPE